MENLMPEWKFEFYFDDSWVLTRDGEKVGFAYKTSKEESFLLFDKRVSKEEFDEFLKGVGMVVYWKYDPVCKKYLAITNRVA